jgi:ABC-2 type transport system permease protein
MRGMLDAARREAQATLGDPGVLLLLIGAVILYSLFYPIPYLPQVLKEVPVVPVDLDRSALSRRLLRMADASEMIHLVEPAAGTLEAETRIREGDAGGALVIPAGFERDVLRGKQVTVGALGDASYFLVYRQAVTGILQATGTLSAGIEIRRLRAQGASETQARLRRDPLPIEIRPLYNPSGGYASYVVPAVFVLILQQTLLIAIGMARGTERERADAALPGTSRDEQGASPLVTTILGRALFYLGLYAVHAVFYFGLLFHLYGFPQRGSAGALALFLLPFLLAAIFLGLALSALFRRRETALQALLFTSLPAIFLAGFSWPVEAMPRAVSVASRLLPSTAGISGFLRLSQMGAGLREVSAEWWTLWGLCALYLPLACLAARHARTRPRRPA